MLAVRRPTTDVWCTAKDSPRVTHCHQAVPRTWQRIPLDHMDSLVQAKFCAQCYAVSGSLIRSLIRARARRSTELATLIVQHLHHAGPVSALTERPIPGIEAAVIQTALANDDSPRR